MASNLPYDNHAPPTPPSPSFNEHLSFPTASTELAAEQPETPPQQPRQLLKDRLYIGNLHPTVDEYSLLQIFSKFGKVTKLDFLFHKAGVMKGKPRGYAFVEYGNNDEALKALSMAHDKLLRGRKLVVTFAQQAPLDQFGAGPSSYGNTGPRHRKGMMETGRPTTLSMLKTGMGGRNDGTRDKIAMMEAKLRQMESSTPRSALPPSSPPTVSTPSTSTFTSTHGTINHPSLPVKPPPGLPANSTTIRPDPLHNVRHARKPKQPLPSLPILPQSQPRSTPSPLNPESRSNLVSSRQPRLSRLSGVKIGKTKEKQVTSGL